MTHQQFRLQTVLTRRMTRFRSFLQGQKGPPVRIRHFRRFQHKTAGPFGAGRNPFPEDGHFRRGERVGVFGHHRLLTVLRGDHLQQRTRFRVAGLYDAAFLDRLPRRQRQIAFPIVRVMTIEAPPPEDWRNLFAKHRLVRCGALHQHWRHHGDAKDVTDDKTEILHRFESGQRYILLLRRPAQKDMRLFSKLYDDPEVSTWTD